MSSQIKSRACVFIDSSSSQQVINLSTQPIIKIPFPPILNPRDLVVRNKEGKLPARVPNAFIIYRKFFIETARKDGYNLPMTVISSMASQSWEQESELVKAEYKRLAKEAYKVRNEMLPKSQRKRKREKWNIISFEEQNRKNPSLRNKEPVKEEVNKSTFSDVMQSTSSPEPQSIDSSPIIPQSSSRETSLEIEQFEFDFTQHMTSNVPSPEILSIEEEITNSINSIDFEKQLLSSPSDLSNISSFSSSFNSDINEPSISFDLLMPINEHYHFNAYEGLGISADSIEFIPTSEMFGMYAYNAMNATNETNETVTEPSNAFDFGYL